RGVHPTKEECQSSPHARPTAAETDLGRTRRGTPRHRHRRPTERRDHMTIHFGTPSSIKTFADAMPRYGRKEFESATRSTVPMLSLLMHALDLFRDIVRGLRFPEEYDLILEYTVGPFGGRGKTSHTDVMLTSGDESLAIEAKWTEPMYPATKDWP